MGGEYQWFCPLAWLSVCIIMMIVICKGNYLAAEEIEWNNHLLLTAEDNAPSRISGPNHLETVTTNIAVPENQEHKPHSKDWFEWDYTTHTKFQPPVTLTTDENISTTGHYDVTVSSEQTNQQGRTTDEPLTLKKPGIRANEINRTDEQMTRDLDSSVLEFDVARSTARPEVTRTTEEGVVDKYVSAVPKEPGHMHKEHGGAPERTAESEEAGSETVTTIRTPEDVGSLDVIERSTTETNEINRTDEQMTRDLDSSVLEFDVARSTARPEVTRTTEEGVVDKYVSAVPKEPGHMHKEHGGAPERTAESEEAGSETVTTIRTPEDVGSLDVIERSTTETNEINRTDEQMTRDLDSSVLEFDVARSTARPEVTRTTEEGVVDKYVSAVPKEPGHMHKEHGGAPERTAESEEAGSETVTTIRTPEDVGSLDVIERSTTETNEINRTDEQMTRDLDSSVLEFDVARSTARPEVTRTTEEGVVDKYVSAVPKEPGHMHKEHGGAPERTAESEEAGSETVTTIRTPEDVGSLDVIERSTTETNEINRTDEQMTRDLDSSVLEFDVARSTARPEVTRTTEEGVVDKYVSAVPKEPGHMHKEHGGAPERTAESEEAGSETVTTIRTPEDVGSLDVIERSTTETLSVDLTTRASSNIRTLELPKWRSKVGESEVDHNVKPEEAAMVTKRYTSPKTNTSQEIRHLGSVDCSFVFECEAVLRFKGSRGEKGPMGPQGSTGPVGHCQPSVCKGSGILINQGKPGKAGPVDRCGESCAAFPAPMGPRGPKGSKGERGTDYSVTWEEAFLLVNHTLGNMNPSQLRIEKVEENRSPHTSRVRRVRREANQYDPPANGTKPDAPSSTVEKMSALGVIILNKVGELKTIGNQMPVGSIVVTYLQDFVEHNVDLPPMGMFVKTQLEDNHWNRVPVDFQKEISYGVPSDMAPVLKPSVEELITASSKIRMVLSYYPIPVSGGSFLGWYGADRICRETGEERLGMRGFRVFLSDKHLPLERILSWRYGRIPIINLAGRVLFRSLRDLLYGMPPFSDTPIYDLNGMPANAEEGQTKYFWLGAGRLYSCDYWRSDNSTDWGLVWTMDSQRGLVKTGYSTCNRSNHILCYKLIPDGVR
ncbi:unnamed protein product [Calicophoron daubneyi]|uniref:Uncharacterized protein n=1 Tax=Calicophoron daubneyi TaxID=300641 RepID=A0AAV2TY18_CALDB